MKANAVNGIVLLLLQQYDAASRKRILPSLKVVRNCIIALSLLILSNFSFAQSDWNNGGDGKTKATAYKISTPEQFRNFVSGVNAGKIKTTHSEQCNNGSGWSFTADLVSYFELTEDIDLSELSPNKMAVLIHKKETSARYLYSGQWVDGTQLTEDRLVEGSEFEVEANYLSTSFNVVSSYPYTWTSSETSSRFSFSDANSVNNETKTKEADLGWDNGKHYKKKTVTDYSYSLIAYTDISFIKKFDGRFYGNGFVIKNLVVNEPNTDNVGLFGLVGSSQHSNMCDALKGDKTKTYKDFLASVESVGLENSMIIGKSNVGGIVGSSNYCEYVKDCFIKNTDVVGNTSVAGIIGLAGTSQYNDCTVTMKYCTIQGCYSLSDIDQEGNGKVTYHHFISGIGNSTNYIGGITGGANQTVNIKDCYSVIGVRCDNSNGQFGHILGGEISANAEFDGIYFIKDWNVDGNTSGSSYDNTSKSNKDKYKENTEEAESMDELNSLLAADNENTLVADEYGINDGAPMTASQYQRFQGEGTLIP
ncbi:MAG: hypothetical protein IJ748_04750, partial [Bacteroidales bacterium]|nr:hypothetical protein [Bacteroidales bacterium]